MYIGDGETWPYIVNISSLPPLTLLRIMDYTRVDKCPIPTLLLVHMGFAK